MRSQSVERKLTPKNSRAMSRLTISQSRDLLTVHLPMAAVAMPDIAHVRQLRKMTLDGSRRARKQLGKDFGRDLRIRPDIIDQLQIKRRKPSLSDTLSDILSDTLSITLGITLGITLSTTGKTRQSDDEAPDRRIELGHHLRGVVRDFGGVILHDLLEAAALALHVVETVEDIGENPVATVRRNVQDIKILNERAVGRSDFDAVIEDVSLMLSFPVAINF